MNNVDQALRLLKELERIDGEGGEESTPSGVTPGELLQALAQSDFNLSMAILGAAQ